MFHRFFIYYTLLLLCNHAFSQGLSLNWVKGFGDYGTSQGHNIVTDNKGNVYVNGFTSGTIGFDADPAEKDTALLTGNGIYLAKYTTNGEHLWSFSLGKTLSLDNQHSGICQDKEGNILITGSLMGRIDFDPSSDSLIYDFPNGMLFVAKYSSEGALVWANVTPATFTSPPNNVPFLAGSRAIDVDTEGNSVIGGFIASNSNKLVLKFGSNEETTTLTTSSGVYFYITKYNSSGELVWLKTLPNTTTSVSGNRLIDLEIDKNDNFFITGEISGKRDFDPSPDSLILEGAKSTRYIAKYDKNGAILWARLTGEDKGFSCDLAIDSIGNFYVSSEYKKTTESDSTYELVTTSTLNITKYTENGELIWTKGTTSKSNNNSIREMQIDNDGYLYITGRIDSETDFDFSASTHTQTPTNNYAVYVAKYDGDGNYIWAIAMGESKFSISLGISIDDFSNVYITGIYRDSGVDFDPSEEEQLVNGVNVNALFFAKYSPCDYTTDNAFICKGDTLMASTISIYKSGTYTISYLNSAGCDSIVTLKVITKPSPNTTLSLDENTLSVVESADSYQWIDCVTNQTIINQSGQSFSANSTGVYAVEVTLDNCTSQSGCESITIAGLHSSLLHVALELYPNPSTGKITLQTQDNTPLISANIFNMAGKLIYSTSFETNDFNLDLSELPQSVYHLQVVTEKGFIMKKIIKN